MARVGFIIGLNIPWCTNLAHEKPPPCNCCRNVLMYICLIVQFGLSFPKNLGLSTRSVQHCMYIDLPDQTSAFAFLNEVS